MSDRADNPSEGTNGQGRGMYVSFQGQVDFLLQEKIEKICHAVLFIIGRAERAEKRPGVCDVLEDNALACVSVAAHFCIGRDGKEDLLALLLETASLVRLGVTAGVVSEGSAQVVVAEITKVVERILEGGALPSVSSDDLRVAEGHGAARAPLSASLKELFVERAPAISAPQKDISRTVSRKRPHTRPISQTGSQAVSDREGQVLSIVKQKGSVSIKDISQVIKGVSEKTLQRTLLALVECGTLRKEGERRWSTYRLA